MAAVILVIYTICLLFILVYSIGQFHLTQLSRKKPAEKTVTKTMKDSPLVTIQLPVFNEKYVVERLLNAVTSFDYPREKLEIQVLDDSDDETIEIVATLCRKFKNEGFDINHVRREDRVGFKAGALKHGLALAKGDFLAIFDSDFIPPANFLKETLKMFCEPNIGMVQAPWGHVNKDLSLLTRLQAFGLNAHFQIEQKGKYQGGYLFHFNGTAGIWRRACILDAGNWQHDTLTEDLDLSYRAQLAGWRFAFAEDVVTPAELPVEMNAFRSQQYRWTKGAAETSKKLFPRLVTAKLPLKQKLHSYLHLLNSLVFMASLIVAVLSVPMLWIKHSNTALSWYFDFASIFLISLVFLAWFYYNAAKSSKTSGSWPFVLQFPVFLSVMLSLSLHNSWAALNGWFGKKTPFIRTPKFNLEEQGNFKKNDYLRANIPPIVLLEVFFVIYFLLGVGMGVYLGDLALGPYHLLLAIGFIIMTYFSIRHALMVRFAK